ncbi:hypothetical protein JYP46_19195 [Nitratireductor aquimarinus]|uniref:hypothetical protein n=1 Tax=Alphaproteobacteria TaxID=28211 RepID=UPI0019D3EEAE|nr:hypothetical protein [Tritonibacter mobilis]MBN7758959.1 hypothetical protein [Nitratireductor aquimarinus]MBY6001632.1 hypothetical protein [Tritonibacter mobilis]MBY6023920.1 hypothetical protein [Nitratireductor sp. DP7N14-4]
MSDRTPCINPRCRRTGPADEFPGEMICGKCFRSLPEGVRREHRRLWREIRKWERRITRTSDEMKIVKMHNIVTRLSWQLSRHWDREIKTLFLAPEKPEGLDAFLEEMGL